MLAFGIAMILASTPFGIAQNHADDASPLLHPPGLPRECSEPRPASTKITTLLESVHDHPTAGAYNTLGVLYAQEDRVSCAIAAFRASVHSENQNWEAHYNLSLALLRKGHRAKAIRELQTAIEQKPDAVSAHFALGTVFEDEKKLSWAEEQFRRSLEIDPHFAPGAIRLSQVLITEGKPQAAVACLEDTLKQSPPADQVGPLQAALGIAYAEDGELEKAFATLKDLVATQPNSADAHFNLALLYARDGESKNEEAAATQFREALKHDESMDSARIALGRVLVSLQKYSDATPVLLEYTRRQPKDAQGFYALGLAYQGMKKLNAAIRAYQRAVALDPRDPAFEFRLGTLLARTGQTDAGIQRLEAAARIDPADVETHKELALLLEKTGGTAKGRAERARLAALKSSGEKERAIESLNQEGSRYLSVGNAEAAAASYRRALQLDPQAAKLHYNLSLALDKTGDFHSERKELEKTLDLDPEVVIAQNQLGLMDLRDGKQVEAEQRFKKVLEVDPNFSEAQANLGVLYSQQGKNTEAVSMFQKALKNDPKNVRACVNFGLLLAQQGAFSEAEQQFREAIHISPQDADAYAALGMLQAKTGRGADAVKSFQNAVAFEPASAQAHLNLGIALADQFDRTSAFKEFSESARLDPKLAATHYNLGRFYFETGKYEDANRELETAIHLQRDYAGALYFLALTAKQQNQVERSTDLLQKLVALQPDNADAQYLLGQNLEHSGDSAAAIEHWKAALQADPNHSQALYNLAKSLNKIHDPTAQQYQDRFDTLQRKQQLADQVSELGNLALEAANARNWTQAMEQMDEAIRLCGGCPQSAHLHKNLGLFYGQTGNVDAAKRELRTALQLAPNDLDAKNALADLERTHEDQAK